MMVQKSRDLSLLQLVSHEHAEFVRNHRIKFQNDSLQDM